MSTKILNLYLTPLIIQLLLFQMSKFQTKSLLILIPHGDRFLSSDFIYSSANTGDATCKLPAAPLGVLKSSGCPTFDRPYYLAKTSIGITKADGSLPNVTFDSTTAFKLTGWNFTRMIMGHHNGDTGIRRLLSEIQFQSIFAYMVILYFCLDRSHYVYLLLYSTSRALLSNSTKLIIVKYS